MEKQVNDGEFVLQREEKAEISMKKCSSPFRGVRFKKRLKIDFYELLKVEFILGG